MQSNEDMDAILKACSDAGLQFMDGVHCSACMARLAYRSVHLSRDS